ncbi:uncharacterized protein TrAFT101_010186 [Trichoderma asperellum]|uniref:Zn(2)-C6 fungal-type domain-containing protein n=1 Tax=Trichoderma asperellum (strain ATCC 204424 / CBS 433.97 / NBRC 101777) TaxID=1042311 RepID=A0A2T3YUT8_TRIA4|nr:hypothetical protein M441DRAFT_202418 [Trichoderma asperellum CBS 433.97]PTB36299.1 hypothetical protein M441DRAFT_202418 [Trichoderma asperellum CBS 433.97]UKZ95341.1 hypothetical protein TrAFT101_010186 [Trichoderma asperellum]
MAETPLNNSSSAPAPAPEVKDDIPPKPYHAKRPHKKSRSGCQNCKARKVKCDESRPTCRSCKLRQADCVYLYPQKTQQSVEAPPSQQSSAQLKSATASSTSIADIASASSVLFSAPVLALADKYNGQAPMIPTELLLLPTGIDTSDMKALWFYATQTCGSFSTMANEGHRSIMRSLLVRYGSESPFLMDTIFALSSSHMLHLNQQFDAQRALTYRVRSLAGYRKAIEEANPVDYPALLANSLLLTALSSQNFREADSKDLYILDWLVVWKGIILVINLVSKSTFLESGMRTLFSRPLIDLEKSASFIPEKLLAMVSAIQPGDLDYPFKEAYDQTLKYLGSLYMDLAEGPSSLMSLRVITIFTFVPREFIDIARSLQPRALVILAYFATFFKLVQSDVWWLEGIGDRTIRDICKYITLEWFDYMRVPFMALDIHSSIELARVILGDTESVSPQKYHLIDYAALQLS